MIVPERPTASGRDPVLVIACREFVELVTEYLEGTLPEEVERAIGTHLELCDPCVAYLEQMRATVRLLGTLPAPALPPAARDRLLDVYTQLHQRRPGAGRGASGG
jgi:anti-sigma factor ChrR (cupin superfamily)